MNESTYEKFCVLREFICSGMANIVVFEHRNGLRISYKIVAIGLNLKDNLIEIVIEEGNNE